MRAIEQNKGIKLDFRVNEKENEKLEKLAKVYNIKRSEVLRRLISKFDARTNLEK